MGIVAKGRMVLVGCAFLLAPTVARAAPVTISAFSGPTELIAGMTGTFQLDLLLALDVTVTSGSTSTQTILQSASFTFDSGEGENTVLPVPLGSTATPSLFATFTFENPGIYTVSASGTVRSTTVVRYVEATPVYETRPDGSVVLVGYEYVQRIDVSSNLQILSDQVQVTVAAAPVTPVSEPATLLLLCTGGIGLVASRRRRS